MEGDNDRDIERPVLLRTPAELSLAQLQAEYTRDDAGHPLGRGMPLGRSLRFDGESHREAWMRILRDDPCAFCGEAPAGTVDHIEPKSLPVRGHGGAYSWANFTGACPRCNQRKKVRPLIGFLTVRVYSLPRQKKVA